MALILTPLAPGWDSLFEDAAALARMPALRASAGAVLEADRIYVVPEGGRWRIEGETFRPAEADPHAFTPTAGILGSLAVEQSAHTIAVLLAPAPPGIAAVMQAIKGGGGIALALDSLADSGADLRLPAAGIADEILRLSRHSYVAHRPPAQPEPTAQQLTPIFKLLLSATGVDFSLYKEGTPRRRILRRMALHRLETAGEYTRRMENTPEEIEAIFQDLLIGVTGFFREPALFDTLKRHVLPSILQSRGSDPVRIWVPGCATGEEAYSIGIVLLECMREASVELPVQIFGTDVNEKALAGARAGIYPESIEGDVGAARLRRFFVKEGGRYRVGPALRQMCIFARQNLIKDPPYARLDLISCRNLLLYLNPEVQLEVMRLFHYALKPEGYLALGIAETAAAPGELFLPAARRSSLFSRNNGTPRVRADFGQPAPAEEAKPAPARSKQQSAGQHEQNRYSPSGIILDHDLAFLGFHSAPPPYLTPGAADRAGIADMLPAELQTPFAKLAERARRKRTGVTGEILRIDHQDRTHHVRLSLTPIPLAGRDTPNFLLLFEEYPEVSDPKPRGRTPRSDLRNRIQELEEELHSTRQYLESVIEEHQATTEELRAANEEVRSSNETLLTTNEQLLTAKEELQTTNQELTAVNREMQNRNAELSSINHDLNSLLASVQIPIVMLSSDLRIRRFTPPAERALHLTPSDLGRPLAECKPGAGIPGLEGMLRDAIANLNVRECDVQDREGRWYTMRIRPRRTADNRIDGAVLVLLDHDGPRPAPASATVLLVASDKSMRDAASRILRQRGYQVLEARGAASAIELARSSGRPVDLVLAEVSLPDGSATDLVQHLGEVAPATRVLLMAGKPFTPEALIEAIGALLNRNER